MPSGGLDWSPGPRTNHELFSDLTDGSTLEVTEAHGDESSGRPQFHHTPANVEALPVYNQSEPQFNFPPHETQPRGTGEHVITKSVRGRGGHTSTLPGLRICTECNKEFGRIQELKRHQKDRHEPPRECLFCDFIWKRPVQIKAHLVADHKYIFPPEMLVQIDALYGQRIVAFVDRFITDPNCHNLDV